VVIAQDITAVSAHSASRWRNHLAIGGSFLPTIATLGSSEPTLQPASRWLYSEFYRILEIESSVPARNHDLFCSMLHHDAAVCR